MGGYVLLAYNLVVATVDWLARAEYIGQRISDPGWIGKVLAPPPPWFTLLTIFVGLGLIYWHFWQSKASGDRPSPTDRTPLYIDALEVYTYLKDRSDWRVRMDKKHKKEAPRLAEMILYMAAAEFKRAAADGAIEVLGRKAGRGSHELIPTVYWLTGSIDLGSIISRRGVKTSVGVESIMDPEFPMYTDLQVIYSGVLKAWPAPARWRKLWRRMTARRRQ